MDAVLYHGSSCHIYVLMRNKMDDLMDLFAFTLCMLVQWNVSCARIPWHKQLSMVLFSVHFHQDMRILLVIFPSCLFLRTWEPRKSHGLRLSVDKFCSGSENFKNCPKSTHMGSVNVKILIIKRLSRDLDIRKYLYISMFIWMVQVFDIK